MTPIYKPITIDNFMYFVDEHKEVEPKAGQIVVEKLNDGSYGLFEITTLNDIDNERQHPIVAWPVNSLFGNGPYYELTPQEETLYTFYAW